jgi:hypothetical protein
MNLFKCSRAYEKVTAVRFDFLALFTKKSTSVVRPAALYLIIIFSSLLAMGSPVPILSLLFSVVFVDVVVGGVGFGEVVVAGSSLSIITYNLCICI